MATLKTSPVTLKSVEVMLDEVAEYYSRYGKLLDKLRRTRQGSEDLHATVVGPLGRTGNLRAKD